MVENDCHSVLSKEFCELVFAFIAQGNKLHGEYVWFAVICAWNTEAILMLQRTSQKNMIYGNWSHE